MVSRGWAEEKVASTVLQLRNVEKKWPQMNTDDTDEIGEVEWRAREKAAR